MGVICASGSTVPAERLFSLARCAIYSDAARAHSPQRTAALWRDRRCDTSTPRRAARAFRLLFILLPFAPARLPKVMSTSGFLGRSAGLVSQHDGSGQAQVVDSPDAASTLQEGTRRRRNLGGHSKCGAHQNVSTSGQTDAPLRSSAGRAHEGAHTADESIKRTEATLADTDTCTDRRRGSSVLGH